MIEVLKKSITKRINTEDIKVTYRLIFKNALYSMECYREDCEEKSKYCYIEDFTDDEGEAETFFKLVVKGEVSPIHMDNMVQDYFGNKK